MSCNRLAKVFVTVSFLSILWASESTLSACSTCKTMVGCDYYVAKKGDIGKRALCAEYAESIDMDGSSARAAWYWLLAGESAKALSSAKRAVETGQSYAAGYAAMALLLQGQRESALDLLRRYRKEISFGGGWIKELDILQRLYPDVGFSQLRSALEDEK